MNTLNLSEFVANTITEIAIGIEKAKEQLKETDVLINPVTDGSGKHRTDQKGYVRSTQNIEFDLSVTVNQEERSSESNSLNGGAKIQVVSIFNFSLGGTTESSDELTNKNAIINRIKFSIPVSFSSNTEGRLNKPSIKVY